MNKDTLWWLIRRIPLLLILVAGAYVEIAGWQGTLGTDSILRWLVGIILLLVTAQFIDAYEDRFVHFKGVQELVRRGWEGRVEPLLDSESIFKAAEEIVSRARGRIWATYFLHSRASGIAPPSYWKTLQKRLENPEFEYKRVMSAGTEDQFQVLLQNIQEYYRNNPNVLLRYSEGRAMQFDLLLSESELLVAFISKEGARGDDTGIRIRDRELVSRVAEWYTTFLWQDAVIVKDHMGLKVEVVGKIAERLKAHPAGVELSAELFLKDRTVDLPFEQYVGPAQEIWLFGATLANIVSGHAGFLKDRVRKGSGLKVLLMDPKSPHISMAALILEETEQSLIDDLNVAKTRFLRIRAESSEPTAIEIRTTSLFPLFSIVGTDVDQPQGRIRVELYPYRNRLHSRPHFELEAARDKQWYDYYRQQFEKLWNDSTPLSAE